MSAIRANDSAPSTLAQATLVAMRRFAQYDLQEALDGPRRSQHLRADQALDAIDHADFWLAELGRAR